MIRIGVDFGGTKIEAAALDERGDFRARVRVPNPGNYDEALLVVRDLVAEAERKASARLASVGMGMPGSISPSTGLIRGANSVWLNGRPFKEDLERVLDRPIRLENDANCFALSEASDGAAAGKRVVFGAILGTGCGGGVVVDGRTIMGANGVAGEWGHTPLPWPTPEEYRAHQCWCGRFDCLETWTSGTGFCEDYERLSGLKLTGDAIVAAARAGEIPAAQALDGYIDRLGRGLAVMCDFIDPDAIVLGGGMSNTAELYDRLPDAIRPWLFSDVFETPIVQAMHGDSSGVRGAAWLWPLD
ncbi:fructokinase [Caulobacter ginsengisoli]|uniref:Fructokinase n=1 Tax=Caulobacter ginsengisoli TaxID=400775 RepID=A0ABU0ISF5_9CAUL|nr:ROK family protein [Caulobacter ginsengisoli]MDQ0464083.1 fructokinase [Caulobacter ginsengisoli]